MSSNMGLYVKYNFQPSEIYDYWGAKAGPVSWRLTVAEIKKILALR